MNNNDNIIYCSRCGAEMRADSRYCMKCGNLNYEHPDNAKMQKFLGKNKVTSYEVGSGNFILGNKNSSQVTQSIANNTGNKILAFLVPFCIYLLIIFGNLFLSLNSCNFDYIKIVSTTFPMVTIVTSIIFLFIYSQELLFMKANKRWWAGLIPVYNYMILSEIAFNKKKLGLICLIPIVNIIFTFVLFYRIGEKFKYNGMLTALLFIFMIPVIGFGSNAFDGRTFVDVDEKNSTEKDYKRKNIFLVTTLLFLIIGVGMMIYANMTNVKDSSESIGNYYYVYAANKMVKKIDKAIVSGKVTCDNQGDINQPGTYYMYYVSVGDEFHLPLQIMMEEIEGYVKVVNNGSGREYYVSLTDGTKGFGETFSSSITTNSVVDYNQLSLVYENSVNCQIGE